MSEGVNAIDAPDVALSRLLRDPLGRMVHASDSVQDPQLVARTDLAVGATVALEGRQLHRRGGRVEALRAIHVVEHTGERRPQVMRVHPIAGLDYSARKTNGQTVLYNLLIDAERLERDLVAGRHVLPHDDGN